MRLPVDSPEQTRDALVEACRVIDAHGVVALPTETFYGLAVSVFDRRGCERVFAIKGRPSTKALPCVVSEMAQLDVVAEEIPPLARVLGSRFWPGPLTLVVPAKSTVAAASELGTVAVRVSSLPLVRELAAAAGPVTATSANVSGAPSPPTADEVIAQLGEEVDLVLDGGQTTGGLASTIVDTTSIAPKLVREGAIDFAEVLRAASEP